MRQTIIDQIRTLASHNGGVAPGIRAFARDTGIGEHVWLGVYWARWSDAVREAGLTPNKRTRKLDPNTMLGDLVGATRHYKHFPTKNEWELYRRDNPGLPTSNVLARHFGSRRDMLMAFRALVDGDPSLADLKEVIGEFVPVPPEPPTGMAHVGYVYLIKSGSYYKIGRSDELERRMKEIRVALPDKAVLIHAIRTDDPPGIESYWHRRFNAKRANGEWFKLSQADVAAFKKRRYQ